MLSNILNVLHHTVHTDLSILHAEAWGVHFASLCVQGRRRTALSVHWDRVHQRPVQPPVPTEVAWYRIVSLYRGSGTAMAGQARSSALPNFGSWLFLVNYLFFLEYFFLFTTIGSTLFSSSAGFVCSVVARTSNPPRPLELVYQNA